MRECFKKIKKNQQLRYILRLNGKYVVTASLRYDESYKFGPLNRGGFFPGASAAWIISNEDFLNHSNAFTFLKLRAGYGKTGNDNIAAFKYQDTFSLSAQYNNVVSAFLERQANFNLGWEEAYMASVGVDATLFNNWNVTLDAYHTINSNLLLDRPLPPSTGFFSVMDNVGKVRNMGVELAVDGSIIKTKDFRWDAGINLGFNAARRVKKSDMEKLAASTGGNIVNKISELEASDLGSAGLVEIGRASCRERVSVGV